MAVKMIEATRRWAKMDFGQLAVLRWYALMVTAGTEFTVEALLERRGFVAVVPMVREWRSPSRYVQRKRAVEYPLAPRYVFVGFHEHAQWDRVFDITMVNSVVGYEGIPWRLSGVEVALFLIRNMFHKVPDEWRHMRTHKEFGVGDWVDVVDGPFAGRSVKVHRIKGDAAKVLIPLFGRRELPLAILAKAD